MDPDAVVVGFLIDGDRVIEDARPWTRSNVWVAPESQIELSTLGASHVLWLRLRRSDLADWDREALSGLRDPFFAQARDFDEVRRQLAARSPGAIRAALVRALRRASALNAARSERESRSLQLARSVEAYMWENVEEPLTLERICKEVNCGVRALIYAFKDVYGVGPMTYWKSRRLNGAHRKLRESMGRVPILEIAADFGFWHMGHFSSDHKHMFGMTPSAAIEAGRRM